jgi:hypothetical protein
MRQAPGQRREALPAAVKERQDGLAPRAKGMGDKAACRFVQLAQGKARGDMRNGDAPGLASHRHISRPSRNVSHYAGLREKSHGLLGAANVAGARCHRRRSSSDHRRVVRLGMRVRVGEYVSKTPCEGRAHEVSILRAPRPSTRRPQEPTVDPRGLLVRSQGEAVRLPRVGTLDSQGPRTVPRAADGAGARRAALWQECFHALGGGRLTP